MSQCYTLDQYNKEYCFPNNRCLNGTSMIGLKWNMNVVPNTAQQCTTQTDCLKKMCIINDNPSVAWIAIRVTG